MPHIITITVLLRDLDALRAACRRRRWEFRAGQRRYRWFGYRRSDRPLPQGVSLDDLGRCHHAIGIPGCRHEVGLLHCGDCYLPLWDDDLDGGLGHALGPSGGKLWQAYVTEVVRRSAHRHGHTVGRCIDGRRTLRLRVAVGAAVAHVRVAADGDTTLWTFGPTEGDFRFLAAALGTVVSVVSADDSCPSLPAVSEPRRSPCPVSTSMIETPSCTP